MSNKITNPFLKQLISGISQKATQGRITGVDWNVIEEAKKNKKVAKKTLKKESDEKKPSQQPEDRYEWEDDPYHSRQFEKSDVSWREYDMKMNPESYRVKEADEKKNPADDAGEEKDAGGLPPLGGKDEAPAGDEASEKSPPPLNKKSGGIEKKSDPIAKPSQEPSQEPSDEPVDDTSPEDVEKAKQDATKRKAELEKSKAETSAAEKELKKHGYIRLASQGGITFLLNKLVSPAVMKNTLDALVPEMMSGLNIKTKKDVDAFKADSALHMTVDGMPELIEKMESLAEETPENTEEVPE